MSKFTELINGEIPVLADFHAEWCGPCKMMMPTINEIATHFKGKLKVIKIDVDKNESATKKYQIMGVPTLILFKNGRIAWKQSGVLSFSDLKKIIDSHL
ncbi:MAG: thioredoxin [Chitinophagaceae bacterium]|nr:MAG: thioredoxin [Chitinophagaceae bacterium]